MNIDWAEIWNSLLTWATNTGVKIIIALIIWLVSFRIITWTTRRIAKSLVNKKKVDKTLITTLFYILRILLKIVVLTCLIGYVGIDTSGLAALIAALGVGIGLAINGALSNLAGGVLLLITRPFKIDDYIEAGNYAGTVVDIKIVYTKLLTPDNKVVYASNGTLSSATIVNYTEKDMRRVDLYFTIERQEDYKKAEEIILSVANAHTQVLKDPAATSRINEHTANGTTLFVKAWVHTADYWDVYYDLQEGIKTALDQNGITLAFNQMAVTVKQDAQQTTSQQPTETHPNTEAQVTTQPKE